jgi:hypothetical protein
VKKPITYDETNTTYTISVIKPSLKYLDFFIRLDCGPKLLATGFYPNAKEITETQGVFVTCLHKLQLSYQDPRVCIVVVGDGFYPRTGYYISLLTSWRIYSVDDAMQRDLEKTAALTATQENLVLMPHRIEDCHIDAKEAHTIVLLFVHSHASLKNSLASLSYKDDTRVHVVSLPCCQEDDLGIPFDVEIEDFSILSVHRNLRIYKDVHLKIPR